MTNIMVDIETLGVGPGACIVSVGAYCLENGACFYEEIQLDRQYRHVDMNTVCWWMQQVDAARLVFCGDDSKKPSLATALAKFCDFYTSQQGSAIWCKGLTFDVPILEDAMRMADIKVPWDFRAPRCWRTLKQAMTSVPYFVLPTPAIDGAAHNALYDAKFQGLQLKAVLDWLKTRT